MPPLDPKKDKDFLSATPEQQHAYLMSVDRDYARATPELQKQYLSSITGGAPREKLSPPQVLANANKPTPKFDEEERRAKYPSTKGVGDTLLREGEAASGAIAAPFAKMIELTNNPPDIPAAIKKTFSPQDEDEKKQLGDSQVGRLALPLYRNLIKPVTNAASDYIDAARGKKPNFSADALSVAPEAVGGAGGSTLLGATAGEVLGGGAKGSPITGGPAAITKAIKSRTGGLIGREQAANLIADATTPNPKMRPSYVQNLMDHWDKITSYAKDKQIPLDSVTNLRKAAQGASDTLQTHFQNLIEPYADQVNPQTGMKLDDMHKRLVSINNDLLPKYERGAGGVDPLQAVKAQEDLHAEASALRFHLYNDLSKATGVPADTLADVNQGSGALRNVGQKTELSESQLKNSSARAGRNPINVSPFSEKQFFINKGANYLMKKAGLTTDPDALVKKAFSRTPSYDYSLPDLPSLPEPLAPKARPAPSWQGDPAASGTPLPPAPPPEPYVSKQAAKAKDAASSGPNAEHLTHISQPEDTSYLSLTHENAEPIAGAGTGAPPVSGDPMSPSGAPFSPRAFKKKALPPPSFISLPASSTQTIE